MALRAAITSLVILTAACHSRAERTDVAIPPEDLSLSSIESWGYQLQGIGDEVMRVETLDASSFDLLVIDYSNGDRPFRSSEVARLRTKPDGSRRLVLAYMSIGEAEDYRFYWKRSWDHSPPDFLHTMNRRWRGNYKVRYWDEEWERILFGVRGGADQSYLDRIIGAGYDGVYLDIVDAFEHFGPGGQAPEREGAATDMAQLVIAISRYARRDRSRPRFIVVPQNGANILGALSPDRAEEYLEAVDGIGAEDTFFYGGQPENNPYAPQDESLAYLDRFADLGKVVLAVDYLSEPESAKRFVELARARGFVPYVGRRELDRLVPQPVENQ